MQVFDVTKFELLIIFVLYYNYSHITAEVCVKYITLQLQ